MEYLEYTFSGFQNTTSAEILIAMLDRAGYSGFLDHNSGFKAYIPLKDKDEDALDLLLGQLSGQIGEVSYSSTSIPETNWNAKWESEFEAVRVEQDVYIRAPFHEKDPDFRYEILIEPKMSFGTGHHETTRLMISSMLLTEIQSKRILDMGCGTGVLSVLASMMDCTSVYAVDIDDWACRNSVENAKLNHCENIFVEQGDASLLKDKSFDVVLANINRNILLADMHAYSDCLGLGGILIISGILAQDREIITEEAGKHGLEADRQFEENNWLSIIFKK